MTTSPHLTAARLMLKELESQLREPVNLKEAQMAAGALERHLENAKHAEFVAALSSLPVELQQAAVTGWMVNKIFNPIPR